MSRLIDADKLIIRLNDIALQEAPNDNMSREQAMVQHYVYEAINTCMGEVEAQKTAFDMDKVVKQLGRKSRFAIITNDKGGNDISLVVDLKECIEVLKGGGTE